jgi:hypothetical protein
MLAQVRLEQRLEKPPVVRDFHVQKLVDIYASEALLAYVILGDGLAGELRALRRLDRRAQDSCR